MIDREALHRLLDSTGALSHPATRITLAVAAAAIVSALAAVPIIARRGKAGATIAADVKTRTLTWAVIAPLVLAPIVTARLGAIVVVAALALLSYREFARATGLFRERLMSALVGLGALGVTYANLDRAPSELIGAVQAVTLTAMCVLPVFADAPKGYIQKVALAAAAFMLFGVGFQRMGMLAHEDDYRPLLLSMLLCTQLNDVFAYCCGRAFGRKKLFPVTSPGKTVAGHAGALLLTTPLAMWMFHLSCAGRPVDSWPWLLALGLIVSIGGQLGDLVISSVKRDIGIKDMGALLPGHGGVLDRCNSLLFVVPAVYQVIVWSR